MKGPILECRTWFLSGPRELDNTWSVCEDVVSDLHVNLDQREMGDKSPPCHLSSKDCPKMRFLFAYFLEKSSLLGKHDCCLASVLLFLLSLSLFFIFLFFPKLKGWTLNSFIRFCFLKD